MDLGIGDLLLILLGLCFIFGGDVDRNGDASDGVTGTRLSGRGFDMITKF